MERVAVYPGSFDPLTNGHLDLIRRGLNVVDRLIVAVAHNVAKQHIFSVEERVDMIKMAVGDNPRVTVDSFNGLLVDYLDKQNTHILLRGLRAVLDFEYEFQMALMNRRMDRKVETIFMMTGYKWFYVSSRIVRDVIMAGGTVEGLVPDYVHQKLLKKFGKKGIK
ncbi:MAG TPA: pantetheine-phosphate adenylyltransferase [Thermodesulfobacteriota bacterium]|nr:pantetheine-phosphate adenylyltransferase [Deltaproteobacteria bacterium]HNR12978.1 pantetheine-phosphate adenylyltransferase [Thermodesulfobacteriota bacterium]HNU72358.1 pantetheine-phosphate adenylyltransferase [Thermodesulfobacteriota bacterium]HOC38599.1 pantetheine-phosphate adenylyltransferase [Thermodesulfobacteriota bacterium]HQO77175.1 pantetheine-phosphate adenylyltransferase [Thermodesulfobacteriota bacterium]